MKGILSILALFLSLSLVAQKNIGSIVYTQTINLEFDEKMLEKMDEAQKQAFKTMMAKMPEKMMTQSIVYFSEQASLCTNYEEESPEKDSLEHVEEATKIKFRKSMVKNDLYVDLKTGEVLESKNFMNRQFLIEGADKMKKWKVSTEIEIIQNYPCQKAVSVDSTNSIIVWFSPMIPAKVGPYNYRDLPGAVLKVSSKDGKFTIVANKIELGKVDKTKMVKPTKGKKVTREEYNKIIEEKRKEMMEMRGSMFRTTKGR